MSLPCIQKERMETLENKLKKHIRNASIAWWILAWLLFYVICELICHITNLL